MSQITTQSFSVNGLSYACPPTHIAVICLDGSADEYLDAAMAVGKMPNLQQFGISGWRGFARGAMPSFTNVNNAAIVTGVPPSKHGIGGNFFYDTTNDREVMMNSAQYLRAETIFPHAARAGRKMAVVTAKEKLRDIFASGLIEVGGIAFSSEKANLAQKATHGIDNVPQMVGRPAPQIYSGDASIYVLQAGVALLKNGLADFLYLSTTDYIQHKFAPHEPEAIEFYAGIDIAIGQLLSLGAVVGVTADHGMNAKQNPDGSPNVIYLETVLTERFGAGFRVILPITDPYVAHHGALGSFATVHLPPGCPSQEVSAWLMEFPGITEIFDRTVAARKLELPADRIGDLVVMSGRNVVIGRTPEHHDLREVQTGLRSHGGRYEEMVPFLFSKSLKDDYKARAMADPRNFDVFDFTLNGLKP